MKVEGHRCNQCNKYTLDVYAEKGWIFIDDYGIHITNGRKKDGESKIEVFFSQLKYYVDKESLDFCSLKCFLNWLFLSDSTTNRYSSTKARKRFMKEILKLSRIKFY